MKAFCDVHFSFLNRFLWNFAWRCTLVKSTRLWHIYLDYVLPPSVPIYIVSKVMFVACTLTVIFLDRFLWNFVWRHSLVKSTCLYTWIMCCPQCSDLYSVKGHVCCVRTNNCIFGQISFKFCMKAYLGKIYMPIYFDYVLPPSVPIYIVSKVMFILCALTAIFLDRFLWNFVWRHSLVKSTCLYTWIMCCPQCSDLYSVKGHVCCVRTNNCIFGQISFKFCMKAYLGKIYMPIYFDYVLPPSVPIYIVSKVMFILCALTAIFLDRFLWNFVWRRSLVKSTCLI